MRSIVTSRAQKLKVATEKEQKELMALAKMPRLKLFLSKPSSLENFLNTSVMCLTVLKGKFVTCAASRTRVHEYCVVGNKIKTC